MGVLDNKVATISGTGSGQGRAAAIGFSRAGAKIFGCDTNAEGDAETIDMVRSAGGIMESISPLDASDMSHAERWAKAAHEAFGGVDILYNNASRLGAVGPFSDSTIVEWENSLRSELTIVYTCTRAVWPYLIERGGGIIISCASFCGHIEVPPFRSAAHGACNAGVVALARTFAAEGAAHNIRSNSISPGFIRTPATAIFDNEEKAVGDALVRKIPLGRMGTAEEIADVALFLASPSASYVNATDFIVDGGVCGISNVDSSFVADA